MNRRGFIATTLAAFSCLIIRPRISNPKLPNYSFIPLYIDSGVIITEALKNARNLAKREGKNVFFVFNYKDYFLVKPNGDCEFRSLNNNVSNFRYIV